MEKREFRELVREVLKTKLFLCAVIMATVGFLLNLISSILSVPQSFNIGGTIIGIVFGNGFTLFLVILPLFEILKSKDSMNFENDCDFGLKYIRISTIITIVFSAILTVLALFTIAVSGLEAVVSLVLSIALLVHSVFQLEIINNLRNGMFYNIEKISYVVPYILLTVFLFITSVISAVQGGNVLMVMTEVSNNIARIIISVLLINVNNNWKKEKIA